MLRELSDRQNICGEFEIIMIMMMMVIIIISKVTILWNQQVQTDRTIPNNKPDIISRDNEAEHVC